MRDHIRDLLKAPLGEFGIEEDDPIFHPDDGFQPQSGTVGDSKVMDTSTNSKMQNLSFRDHIQEDDYVVESEVDATRRLQDMGDAALGDFFKRPVRIYTTGWGTGTSLGVDFDPWNLFFTNPRVTNRLSNYYMMRCKLHLKFVINGNGFHYGRAIAGYLPYDKADTLSTNAALVPEDIVQTSQLPHIYLNPTMSTGGELVLPFFWHKNYIPIIDSSWDQMGQVYLRSINDLKHANGASDSVTISVFAWAEDMELTMLTSTNPIAMVPQSGKERSEVDEANATGVISKPATAIAKMAGALSTIPSIAPYAMATSAAAGTVAKIAKQFGYCRPTVTENPAPRRLFPTSSLATTNTPDTALKLTVDDKQELSIDPRIAGLGSTDPMAIKEIAKRESYLTKYPWNLGVAADTQLFACAVSPVLWAEDTLTPKGYHFPACCMAAMPFKYWTGTFRIRFQIVCSTFHKGRIAIQWDPYGFTPPEYNTNYTEIVDISEKQDFTMEISNGKEFSLLDHSNPGPDFANSIIKNGFLGGPLPGNGIVTVSVLNELTVPNSTAASNIEVNVFISMGDDFEVFVPTEEFQQFVFKAQSGEEVDPDAIAMHEDSAPYQDEGEQLGADMVDLSQINAVFTGESIQSFRTMLKRYNLWRREFTSTDGAAGFHKFDMTASMYPFLRGNVAGAVDTAGAGTTNAPYNYVNTVLLHWVTLAFQGWRGSIRYKILDNRPGYTSPSNIYVQRIQEQDALYVKTSTAFAAPATYSQGSYGAVYNNADPTTQCTGPNGLVYQNSSVNPTVEYEVPFYSNERFIPGKLQNYSSVLTGAEGYQVKRIGYDDARSYLDFHVAAGEDFQVFMWTGLPRMYYEPVPPTF